MAVNRVPVLKRCRSLGLDPVYLGIDKKSNRSLKRSNRKMSEYGLQLFRIICFFWDSSHSGYNSKLILLHIFWISFIGGSG